MHVPYIGPLASFIMQTTFLIFILFSCIYYYMESDDLPTLFLGSQSCDGKFRTCCSFSLLAEIY